MLGILLSILALVSNYRNFWDIIEISLCQVGDGAIGQPFAGKRCIFPTFVLWQSPLV